MARSDHFPKDKPGVPQENQIGETSSSSATRRLRRSKRHRKSKSAITNDASMDNTTHSMKAEIQMAHPLSMVSGYPIRDMEVWANRPGLQRRREMERTCESSPWDAARIYQAAHWLRARSTWPGETEDFLSEAIAKSWREESDIVQRHYECVACINRLNDRLVINRPQQSQPTVAAAGSGSVVTAGTGCSVVPAKFNDPYEEKEIFAKIGDFTENQSHYDWYHNQLGGSEGTKNIHKLKSSDGTVDPMTLHLDVGPVYVLP